MYSSVKFFEPTVIVTLPLAGFDWISWPPLAVVDDEDELLPHDARAIAMIETATRANNACSLILVLMKSLLHCLGTPRPAGTGGSYAAAPLRCKASPRGVRSRCSPASENSTTRASSATRTAPASTPSSP